MDGTNWNTRTKDNFIVWHLYKTDEILRTMDGYLANNEFKDRMKIALHFFRKEKKETDQWTEFNIPFDCNKYGNMEALSLE